VVKEIQLLDPLATKKSEFLSQVQLLPGAVELMPAHQRAGQQPDNLCGPYWVAILLEGMGVATLRADEVAKIAGAILPNAGNSIEWVPPGGVNRQDYSVELTLGPLEDSGTSVQGLIEATRRLSGDRYTLIPLKTRWTAQRVEAVMQLCQIHPHWNATPLCNIKTGFFWGSRLPLELAIAYLNGTNITPPPADWNVGHFVSLAGVVQGTVRSLVIVRDTYPILGWEGYYLQPAEAIANAMNRDGYTSEGGLLLFVATEHQAEVEAAVSELGVAIEPWDNGTPWP
jgi:hypothetical protein